jgi:hypothetical protein
MTPRVPGASLLVLLLCVPINSACRAAPPHSTPPPQLGLPDAASASGLLQRCSSPFAPLAGWSRQHCPPCPWGHSPPQCPHLDRATNVWRKSETFAAAVVGGIRPGYRLASESGCGGARHRGEVVSVDNRARATADRRQFHAGTSTPPRIRLSPRTGFYPRSGQVIISPLFSPNP